jgi:hypothetical protein
MTYTSGSLIEATDYNGFAATNSGANVNDIWGTGSGDKGYGQSTILSTVSTGGTVSASSWADLNNRITSLGNHTNTSITSRSNPTTGSVIAILSNLNTDLTNVTNNRGNAVSSGTTSSTWTGSTAKTSGTGSGGSSWTITWTHTVTFPSANQARYFWNAGGLVRLDMSKTSTGTGSDTFWNTFVGYVGTLYISGRVNSAAQTISGTSYTGTTRIGGTGGTQNTLATTTGWYSLTPGAASTTLFKLFDTQYLYTDDYIQVNAAVNAGSTVLTLTTTWFAAADTGNIQISGGTDTASPYTTFGTAPAVLCRFVPPETTYLTNTWGTPVIAASVA